MSDKDEYHLPTGRRKLPSLVHLATVTIIHNISQLQDIGQTPYHLMEPILSRMNSKQLAQTEENSPHIVPDSDVLWRYLIEKDFPDRPLKIDTFARNRDNTPHRTLYNKYMAERETFRQDSAKRLRRITQQIQMKKSENKIVTVSTLLKDPTIKRRSYSSYNRGGGSYGRQTQIKSGSILSKARRDLQARSLIFSKQHLKPYSPYDAFKKHAATDSEPYMMSRLRNAPNSTYGPDPQLARDQISATRSPAAMRNVRSPTQFRSNVDAVVSNNVTRDANTRTEMRTSQSVNNRPSTNINVPNQNFTSSAIQMSHTNSLPVTANNSYTSISNSTPPAASETADMDLQQEAPVASEEEIPTPIIRRRRPEPSIFLKSNKRPKLSPTRKNRSSDTIKKNLMPESTENRKIKAIKSSIFS
ncbi:RNA polymerase II transcription factor SIII subunit A-domain-containing protein [Scheffersomyces xylosifermentans]|uniref:RNA polymerase II transcription factor SIII subunit A-domain-containing protein n=1 Tax=Scheffersomyces xylosifermentans TaxID=1304137 RepID=UPI00315DC323